MGQKINPTGFRLAVTHDWGSKWYANSKNFAAMLNEDLKVRDYLKKKLPAAVGPQIDVLLSNDANVKAAENIVGGLFGKKK